MHCCSVLQVLNTDLSPGLPGEALLDEMSPLVRRFPQNQALMCLQARQQMQLGRLQDVLQTVAAFLGCSNDMAASRWALHLTVHVHWLTGELNEVLIYISLLDLPDVLMRCVNIKPSFGAWHADYSVVCNEVDSFAPNTIKGFVSTSVMLFSDLVFCLCTSSN